MEVWSEDIATFVLQPIDNLEGMVRFSILLFSIINLDICDFEMCGFQFQNQ